MLAAGLGERLRADGIETPKALVQVAGRPLLHHALEALAAVGARDALVAINERDAAAAEAVIECRSRRNSRTLDASHHRLEPRDVRERGFLAAGGGCALRARSPWSTASSRRAHCRASRQAVARIVRGAAAGVEGLVGVSTRPDEDRPLRVLADPEGRVVAIGRGAEASPLATAGLYLLPARALQRGPSLLAAGGGALRELLATIVREGVALEACSLGGAVDVDRRDDLAAAEAVAACS